MCKENCYIKDVTKEDMMLLYRWANDAEVRKNSFSSKPIDLAEHKAWFEKIFEDENVKMYLLYVNENPAAQVRLIVDGDEATIHYSVASEFRCMGYGKYLISSLYKKVREELLQINKLIAYVKPDNIASRSVFIVNGYTEVQEGRFEKEIDRTKDVEIHYTPENGGYSS